MNSKYRRLLAVELSHSYFQDSACPAFDLQPLPATQQIIKGYKLLYRAHRSGFNLMYRADESGGNLEPFLPISEMELGACLRFGMYLKDVKFLNYTDFGSSLPSLKGNILVFRSAGGTLTQDGGLPDLLQVPDFITMPLRPQEFTFRFSVAGNPGTCRLVIRNARGRTVRSIEVTKAPDDTYSANLALLDVEPGSFTFQILHPTDGIVSSKTYYLDSTLAVNPPFAVIELVHEADAGGSHWKQIQDHNETPTNNAELTYDVRFSHRSAVWKYTVVLKYTIFSGNPSDYVIIDNMTTVIPNDRYNTGLAGDKFFFADPPAVESLQGHTALVFTSRNNANVEESYPWYEEAKHDLVLAEVDGSNNITRTLIRKLPNPDAGYSKPEIIVYI